MPLLVVEGDQAVGEDEGRVGERRAVGARRRRTRPSARSRGSRRSRSRSRSGRSAAAVGRRRCSSPLEVVEDRFGRSSASSPRSTRTSPRRRRRRPSRRAGPLASPMKENATALARGGCCRARRRSRSSPYRDDESALGVDRRSSAAPAAAEAAASPRRCGCAGAGPPAGHLAGRPASRWRSRPGRGSSRAAARRARWRSTRGGTGRPTAGASRCSSAISTPSSAQAISLQLVGQRLRRRRASGSGRPRSRCGMPAKSGAPSCSTALSRPCIGSGAGTTRPP